MKTLNKMSVFLDVQITAHAQIAVLNSTYSWGLKK